MNDIDLILEAERRGLKIPEGKLALLNEAISRGLIPEITKDESVIAAPQIQNQTASLQSPPIPQEKELGLGEAVTKGISNIPESAVSFVENIATAVSSPIETAKAVGQVAVGALQKGAKAIGLDPTDGGKFIPQFDSLIDFFGNRYGSFKDFKKTLSEDPVGVAADLSSVFSGGASIAAKSGSVKVAAALKKAAKASDPLSAVRATTGLILKPAKETLAGVLGVTTGVGTEAIKVAAKGGEDFRSAIRGKIPESQIVEISKSALNKIREERRINYVKQVEKIGLSNKQLNISPIKAKLKSLMKQFRIKEGKELGDLDFSRSSLDRTAWKPMTDLINDIRGWGSQAGDLTPIGMDLLKQRVDDFFVESKNSRAFVTPLKDSIKKSLIKNVPGYDKLVGDYAKTSEQINEIEKALSLGARSGADTILKKLNSMMRENSEYRKVLVRELEDVSGSNIMELVAGTSLKPLVPGNRLLPAVAGASQVTAAATTGRPEILLLLALGSPKLVGEFTNLAGRGARLAGKAGRKFPSNALFQSGRIKDKTVKDLIDPAAPLQSPPQEPVFKQGR